MYHARVSVFRLQAAKAILSRNKLISCAFVFIFVCKGTKKHKIPSYLIPCELIVLRTMAMITKSRFAQQAWKSAFVVDYCKFGYMH